MPFQTTFFGSLLFKVLGASVIAGALASALGFMFMWPKTRQEAFIRIACTTLSSTIFGPALVVALRSWMPSLFDAAKELAIYQGADPTFGILFLAAPLLVMAGLPAWYILGGLMRWFDKRKEQDIGEMAGDAADLVHDVRGRM